jgi:galactokinase
LLKGKLPNLKSLRDVSAADFHKHKSILPEVVARRAQHIVEEINRSEQAAFLLKQNNVKAFGRLMNECHTSLRDLYEVSCPELDVMARIAQALPGCYGARLTGAGFGGCTVNLVARDQAGVFAAALAAGYESETGHHPEIYICNASAGARLL